ncbi:MAG: hypothetical protein ACAI25_09090 [Planctomycetota bacterium]
MLDRLDDIDWTQHQHAYGSAADVPDLLRALASTKKKKRDAAWHDLHGNVWHQGTVWEVTPLVVPFLIELVAEKSVAEKHALLNYLARLAGNGNLEADPEDAHGLATRDAVTEGFFEFTPFLESDEVTERIAASFLLGQLPNRAKDVVAALRTVVERGGDERVVASACFSLAQVAPRDLKVAGLLRQATEGDAHSLPRVAAAMALVCYVETGPVPLSVVRALVAALEKPGPLEKSYADLPWRSSRLDLDVCGIVKRLDRELAPHFVPALLVMLEREKTPYTATIPVGALLHFVFGEPDWKNFEARKQKRRPPGKLTAEQRRLLEVFLAKDMWITPSGAGNGNLGALLNPLELPTTRQELESYLGS